jgi:sodium transport system permease protein
MSESRSSASGRFLQQTLAVLANEMRIQFRDGHVLISTLLLPLLLYPLIFWGMGEFISVGRGRLENTPPRIGVAPAHSREPLVRHIAGEEDALICPTEDGSAAISTGDVDAYLRFDDEMRSPEDPEAGAPRRMTLLYDASRPRSARTHDNLGGWVANAESRALEAAFQAQGAPREAAIVFATEYENVATAKQMGGFLLGLLLPITIVAMTSMGAFYPAIDVLVGERERKTFESLLSSGASRMAVIMGKYLTVVMAATVAGSLNLGSMLLTALQFLRSVGDLPEGGISIPFIAVPVMLFGALLLGAFLGAAMMLLASLARSFKEGQSLVTPFYTIAILPAMLTAFPGFRLSWDTALVPVMNIALMMRAGLHGSLPIGPALLSVGWNLLLTAALLMFAAWLFRQEDVLVNESGGSLTRYLRERFRGARRLAPAGVGGPGPTSDAR